jgi:hypothetical protein
MHIYNGTKSLLNNANKGNIVALDIGFAKHDTRSCGVALWKDDAIQSWNSPYGELISFCCGWPTEELHLIVEAPLFFVFDDNGNPAGRMLFEDPSHYWYLQTGVTEAFSTLNLFLELSKSGITYRLFVYEGYLPHFGERQPHALDAAGLLAAAMRKQNIIQYERTEFKGIVRSIHYYIGLAEMDNLPPVIQPL